MTGRDPHEQGRVATGLELFYDLVFVVGFSVATGLAGHQLAEAHFTAALVGFLICTFATIWAWINFAWFASAFDTDDWGFRVVTLVQMIGVAIIAVGMPAVFTSVAEGGNIDNRVMILGYVVMRVGMVIQWLRAAAESEQCRRACLTYAVAIVVAQFCWVAIAIAHLPLGSTIVAMLVAGLIELMGPVIAETRAGGTPWHAHHIAERYSLLTIITLGEGVVGVVALLSAQVAVDGWTLDTAILGFFTMTTTFAMWWIYAAVPVGEALHARRGKCFPWGYGHIVLFMAAVGVGVGLHVAALYLEHHAEIDDQIVAASFAVPMAVFCLGVVVMYGHLLGFDAVSVVQAGVVIVVIVASIIVCSAGASVIVALVVASLAPVAMVIVDELVGDGRRERALGALRGARRPSVPVD
ncbi:low temperature requirement protein A [Gordonia paraffinivorans]|uniref:low temperature requirement protein A n=1 Tax=Gordonia paraffinivorans TaxID=175628 RepID=UPI001C92E872|nr:low temperature requirement protein A [Gordonia paraffinivorans]MBY4573729.1 low temperature requirement protein A [Gordonia paraffinivorans]